MAIFSLKPKHSLHVSAAIDRLPLTYTGRHKIKGIKQVEEGGLGVGATSNTTHKASKGERS